MNNTDNICRAAAEAAAVTTMSKEAKAAAEAAFVFKPTTVTALRAAGKAGNSAVYTAALEAVCAKLSQNTFREKLRGLGAEIGVGSVTAIAAHKAATSGLEVEVAIAAMVSARAEATAATTKKGKEEKAAEAAAAEAAAAAVETAVNIAALEGGVATTLIATVIIDLAAISKHKKAANRAEALNSYIVELSKPLAAAAAEREAARALAAARKLVAAADRAAREAAEAAARATKLASK